jgi:DMSO/TMAO reductase YedYZ molybdopterin-dependent catalytic subunit
VTSESTPEVPPSVPVGRRLFLGVVALGALGVALGTSLQSRLGRLFGTGIANLLPGGDHFRIYSLNGVYPTIPRSKYRLEVTGLVQTPRTFSYNELTSMPSTRLVKTFQCVTGWRVPDVAWEGVRLSHLLEVVGAKSDAVALSFESYDGADTESLTIDQAHLPDVIVAYRMLDGPISVEHGGPVRLYVAPMYGYKSLKWLSAIRVVDAVAPGYWEQNGYPVNGWLDGSTGPTNSNPSLA